MPPGGIRALAPQVVHEILAVYDETNVVDQASA